mmetsp:Transcript_13084/g.23316  ORF Transcript_13084/g.23316 Transcript_13084/m.23316 type:complete len:382 (-) Transcript_13084:52-1197(-)
MVRRRAAAAADGGGKVGGEKRKNKGGNIHHAGTSTGAEGGGEQKGTRWRPAVVLGLLTAVVLVPRACVVGYYHACLHAGWDRPAVALEEERPLLIVGTMASGTKQMVVELGRLGIEMGHENSDTTSHFARDGTVSWTHGLRFLPTAERSDDATRRMCRHPRFNCFHPTMFRPSANCSYRFTLWSDCWRRECAALWDAEFGCHHPSPDDPLSRNQTTCTSPFTKALLQVRHPLRVISSLLAKSGETCSNAVHQIAVIRTMFPAFDWDTVASCTEFWGHYWLLYNRAMLPHVDGWYRVEHTPPCEVARQGGLLTPGDERGESAAAVVCRARQEGEGPGHGERHGTVNRKNKKRETVSWADVKGLPQGLGEQLAELAQSFGYTD